MPSMFLQLAHKVLKEEKRPLSAAEIWGIAQAKGYEKDLATKGKTPLATLGAMLYVDVRDNLRSDFVSTGKAPKRFVLRELLDQDKGILDIQSPATEKVAGYLEKDIHPFLVYFGFYYLRAHLKTIRHHKSEKKRFGEWVHPDLVGCYFPFDDWEDEVVEVSSVMGNPAIKLYSFELKRELSIGNLREAFFQAVSNSSWANEGYLAAVDIDVDEEFRGELNRLSASFGIGVIRIDIGDPDSSEIIYPAKAREVVDWEAVNKLASVNPDFCAFLRRIRMDMKSREVRREMYDGLIDRELLVESLRKR